MHDALTDLRQADRVPWDWIEDESRSVEDYTGYSSIMDGVLLKLPYIRLDPWQPRRPPLVITESRTVAGAYRETAGSYAVPLVATGGQCGGFLRTDVAPLLQAEDEVLYTGDLDLAGDDIEANTRRVLERLTGPLRWKRLALTQAQVSQYDLPVIIKRDRRFKDGRPHQAVETEALRQRVLVDILTARLDELLPEPLERVLERESEQRRRIEALLRRGP